MAQRARHSSSKQALYDDAPDSQAPASCVGSVDGSAPGGDHFIQFTELDDDTAVQRLWADLRRSLGER
jgi:hypothetical protein